MATRAPTLYTPVQQFVLEHVTWEAYERLLADYLDSTVSHFTYDRDRLEMVSPSMAHHLDNQSLNALVKLGAFQWRINLRNVGSATDKRHDLQRGFEADQTVYIQHAESVRLEEELTLPASPPPDLVFDIEYEVTHTTIPKLPIYAEVGIPEVWRVAEGRVTILTLKDGDYGEATSSLALPLLDANVLGQLLYESRTMRHLDWMRAVRSWARDQVPMQDATA